MAYKATVLKIHPDAISSAVLLGGMLRQTATPNLNVMNDPVAGSPYPLFSAITDMDPRIVFETYDLPKALGNVGLTGLAISSATLGRVGVELYELLYDDYGQLASGSVHRKLQCRKGVIFVRRISCAHGQDARVELELIGLHDGTNPIWEPSESVAAPGAATDPTRHTLGPVSLGDVDLERITNVDIEYAVNASSQGTGSNPYRTYVDVPDIKPTVRVQTRAPNQFSDSGIPLTGKVAEHADSLIVFRKRVRNTATFVADETAEHISLTTNGTLYCDEAFAATANAEASSSYRVASDYDGTNAPLVIDTAYAIA